MLRNQFKKKYQEKIILAIPSNVGAYSALPYGLLQSSSDLNCVLRTKDRPVGQNSLETGPLVYENMIYDRNSFKSYW